MPLVADRCICLRKVEYSETSQILTLLAREHGIVKAIAKGAHRRTKAGASRFDGGVDLLDIGQAVFTSDPSREMSTLTEWKLQEGHPALRRNLRSLYLSLYAAELVWLLFEEHDPHPQVFDQLEQVLSEMGGKRIEESFLAFELDLLREAGFMPELGVCVSCGQPAADREPIYFSAARGGIVCQNCHAAFPDRMEVDVRLLRLLQMIQSPPEGQNVRRLPQLTRHQTDPLNRLLAGHVEYALGRRPRAVEYVLPTRQKRGAGQFSCNSTGHPA
jgi:DNA repair protein RecO (recombination protein O)